jgi:hypothetical protein
MVYILLFYVLPSIISLLIMYFWEKHMGGTIKTFLEILPYTFIPLVNIMIIFVTIVESIDNWLKKDDNWQNFLNKKL